MKLFIGLFIALVFNITLQCMNQRTASEQGLDFLAQAAESQEREKSLKKEHLIEQVSHYQYYILHYDNFPPKFTFKFNQKKRKLKKILTKIRSV